MPIAISHLEYFGEDDEFRGALLDTGVQKSVIGEKQAKLYCAAAVIPFKLSVSKSRFSFGAGNARSMGCITILVVTPGSVLRIHVDVIKNNIPFLIGLDVLDHYGLQVLTVENMIDSVKEAWKTPVARKYGHVYYCWESIFSTFLSKPQLERLHKHLLHPSTTKLYELLSRSGPENISGDTRTILKEISDNCETYQVYSRKQFAFRITENGEVKFTQRVLLDFFYLETNSGK